MCDEQKLDEDIEVQWQRRVQVALDNVYSVARKYKLLDPKTEIFMEYATPDTAIMSLCWPGKGSVVFGEVKLPCLDTKVVGD
jgi:hypothetical protein